MSRGNGPAIILLLGAKNCSGDLENEADVIGRMLEALPTRLGTPLIRRDTVRALLLFWATHGADWMPFQEQLERYVLRNSRFHFDERVVRRILARLVEAGIVHRAFVPPRIVQYRLDRRFAIPTWPGFAREIDDLLVDPIPWVTSDGRFFKVGIPNPARRDPYLFLLATRPHYFAVHAWTRAWIHAFNQGLLSTDPKAGLETVRRVVREAPMAALGLILRREGLDTHGVGAAQAVRATNLYREASPILFDGGKLGGVLDRQGRGPGRFAERALEVLHSLCGHTQAPYSPPRSEHGGRRRDPRPRSTETRLLTERAVYQLIDYSVMAKICGQHSLALGLDGPALSAWWDSMEANQGSGSPSQIGFSGERVFEPALGLLAPRIRALAPGLRHSMVDYFIAWPSGEPPGPW